MLESEKLNSNHPVSDFNSGCKTLDDFIQKDALHQQDDNISCVYVLFNKSEKVIVGYYALSSSSLENKMIDGYYYSYNQVPAILLTRFAIDKRFQGQGYGKNLLLQCFEKILEISEMIASYVLVLDVSKDNIIAKKLYDNMGFTLGRGQENNSSQKMYFPIEEIKNLLK